jgi:uncharacterized repeat protein (TIGR02543 family)
MKLKHQPTWFRSRLLAVTLLLGANPCWAEPTIPQDVLDAIAQDGTARIIVELDVPWQPEGLLADADAVAAQRGTMTDTQTQFVETLNQELENDGIIDSAHSADGTPTVPAARTFETVPYLVMVINSVTLPYVQQSILASAVQLSLPDEPSLQESIPLIGADKAWEQGFSGKDQLIAVVDSGVDKTHPLFAPSRVVDEACFSFTKNCPNSAAEQIGSGAAVPCDFDADNCGHGTHVTGIAASVAKDAGIVAVQVASNFGAMGFFRDDQIAALEFLHKKYGYFGTPLAAVNISLGGGEHALACDGDARRKIIQNLHSVGVATIASSGNQGHADGISAPACISEAISVGATDKAGQIWSQSNRAGILDLLVQGVGIESALPGGLTGAKDGTSMAAPHVAGAWAIMKAANPEASIAEILGKLKDTGQDVDGTRRIQVDAALQDLQLAEAEKVGIITTIAGIGVNGYSGDGGPAIEAKISYPRSVALDKKGNLYISERFNHRIRKVDLNTGIITTFAGTGIAGYSGDGGPAINAQFGEPNEMIIDHNGNIYVCEAACIRKIDTNGIVTTIAGTGITGYSGDGGPVTQARITGPYGMAMDKMGNLYFSSWPNHRVRKIDTNGIISTVVGTSVAGYSGDNGLATNAQLNHPSGLAIDDLGNLYIADGASFPSQVGGRIRKVDTNGIITTIAGDGTWGYSGDNGPATEAQFYFIGNLTLDRVGNLYVTDGGNHRIRKIDTNGMITTVVGNGIKGFSHDGVLATEAQLNFPVDIEFDHEGNLYIADGGNQYRNEVGNARVFKVTYNDTSDSACGGVTDGLVACYPFDGNAIDGSGNGNHGILQSGVSFVDGKIGKSAEFNGGNNAYIRIPHNATQKFDDKFSVAGWVLSNGHGGSLFTKYTWNAAGGGGKGFFVSGSDDLVFSSSGSAISAFARFNTSYSGEEQNWPVHQISTEQFHYFTVTYDDSQIKLYINAELKSEKTIPFAKTLDNSYDMLIGAFFTNDGKTVFSKGFFDGLLDELRVYNRALSESEIQTLYRLGSEEATLTVTKIGEGEITSTDNTINCGETCQADYEVDSTVTLTATPATGSTFTGWNGDCTGTSATTTVMMDVTKNCAATFEKEVVHVSDCDIVSDGLLACYPFDGNANDGSGNGKDGIENGNIQYVQGISGNALNIQTEGDYVEIPKGNNINLNTPNKSISVWFKAGTLFNEYNQILDKTSSSDYALNIFVSNGNYYLRFGVHGGSKGYNFIMTPVLPYTWYHTVVVKAENQIILYLNGSEINSIKVSNITTKNNSLIVGSGGSPYDSGYSFKGPIDELRIYNRVLTDSEIQTLYNLGQSNESGLTVTKTGTGRGTIRAKIKGEDWTLSCKSNCQKASYDYAPDSEVIVRAYPEKGFTFNGWTGDCTGTDKSTTVTIDTAKTCIAQFEPEDTTNLLTVNQDGTGNGTITTTDGYINCGTNCSAFYRADKKVRLEATPAADNLFMGWNGACSGLNNKVRVTMDAAKSCTATFKPYHSADVFALTVNNGGDGRGTISARIKVKGEKTSLVCRGRKGCKQATHDYDSGSIIQLYAVPNAGFEFTDGSGDCPWESYTDKKGRLRASATIIMDQAKDCTANFGRKSDLTWHKLTIYTAGTGNGSVNNPARIDCGDNCTADYYQEGDTFWLKAVPTLSKFIGWTGDCETKGSGIKVTMSQDMTCTANFQSDFEIIAEEDIVDAFYATATLKDGRQVAQTYPRAANEARLKEAFWLAIIAIMQVDQHLTVSNSQTWPTQFDGIEWLPSDINAEYTHSVQIIADQFIGIKVELIDKKGAAEKIGIVIYYGDEQPVIDDSGWSRELPNIAFFSRYAFTQWW